MFAIAAAGAAVLTAGWRVRLCRILGAAALAYGGYMGGYMTWSSRYGKIWERDRLLARAGRLRPWRGNEMVVDVGCGRGLMLVGAAKCLRGGTA